MFDVIVIGAGISGLMCANILSRTGLRVLVLEKAPKIGGMLQGFTRRGVSFDTGFHYVGGLGPGESLEWIFRYHRMMDLPWVPLDASEEVCLEGERYLIPCGFDAFVDGMARYFPSERAGLAAYAEALQNLGSHIKDLDFDRIPFFEKSAAAFLSETIREPRLRRVLTMMGPRMEMRLESLPFYEYAQISGSFIESAWRLDGPAVQLAEVLAGQVRRQGGDIRCGCGVESIAAQTVTAGGQAFSAPHIISTLPPACTVALAEGLRPSYRHRIQSLEETGGMFTAYLELAPGRVPYVNHGVSLDGPVFVHFYPPQKGGAWADRIELMMPVSQWPAARDAGYARWKASLTAQGLAVAETRFPGLKDAVKAVYTSSPLTWQRYTGSASAFGVRKDYRAVLNTVLSCRTPLPGLWLAGQSVALHGLLGVSMTVLNTISQIYGKQLIRKEFAL
ncbi:MAG: NAD(P)/FAD-dependent oxidoreductase [Bacteroidales bacterium]|nr:NAD(P)/FAD-dependent oxidoreductase [Bacteroidales bacterium]